ncbi:hypothetical protein [Burkholderia pseudomallei]|uniref:hypothetical protein n=1 Tax=Burkholderia pseudomallei TaxID=28450 RepID=UPI0005722CDC|nr:hypothetical protein [Burkholderia pseudomallei]
MSARLIQTPRAAPMSDADIGAVRSMPAQLLQPFPLSGFRFDADRARLRVRARRAAHDARSARSIRRHMPVAALAEIELRLFQDRTRGRTNRATTHVQNSIQFN